MGIFESLAKAAVGIVTAAGIKPCTAHPITNNHQKEKAMTKTIRKPPPSLNWKKPHRNCTASA